MRHAYIAALLFLSLSEAFTARGDVTYYEYTLEGRGREITAGQARGFPHVIEVTDDEGRTISVSYYGPGGIPVTDDVGIHKTIWKRDKVGRLVDYIEYGVEANSPVIKERIKRKYDAVGNEVSTSYYGIYGRPSKHIGDIHRYEYRYDENGNKTRVYFFGVRGQPVADEKGIHAYKYAFDHRGKEIRKSFLGISGQPVTDERGVHAYEKLYDSRGRILSESYYGPGLEPICGEPGVHRFEYSYGIGGITSKSHYGPDNLPAADKHGVHRYLYSHKEYGKKIEEVFGTNGKPLPAHIGPERTKEVTDALGGVVSVSYEGDVNSSFRTDSVRKTDSGRNLQMRFEKQDNISYVKYYDTDGNPATSDGVHFIKEKLDAHGRLIEEAYFGLAGEPIALYGVHKYKYSYYRGWDKKSEKHYNTKGKCIKKYEFEPFY